MAERGIIVDHSTLHRWVIRLVPLLDKVFRRNKRAVGRRWRMDETYIKIKGQWKYLYRAVDTAGQTVDFLLTAKRDAAAALRFFRKAICHHGEPEVVTIDKSGANTAAPGGYRTDTYDMQRTICASAKSGLIIRRYILSVDCLKYRQSRVCELVVVNATEPFYHCL